MCVLYGCVGDGPEITPRVDAATPQTPDAGGTDAAVTRDGEAPTDGGAEGSIDANQDAGKGTCDRSKNFAAPQPMLEGVDPLVVRFFRAPGNLGHVYYVPVATPKVIRGGTVSDAVVNGSAQVLDVGQPINNGIAISPNERDLLVIPYGTTAILYQRTAESVPFTAAPSLPTFVYPSPGANDLAWHPYLPRTGGILFGLGRDPTGMTSWDIMAGSYDTLNVTASAAPGLKPPLSFQYAPVPVSATHMILSRWGVLKTPASPAEAEPKLFEARRTDAAAPWGAPTALVIDGFTPADVDQLIPFDLSEDQCTFYFGKRVGPAAGQYNVLRARRPQ